MEKLKERIPIGKSIKKRERIEKDDVHWWLGPVGVMFVVLLILLAIIKNSGPIRLDDLGDRAKARARRMIAGKQRAIWLNMQVSPITKDAAREFGINPGIRGVVVTDLNEGQGAYAGMNVGDVIVAINGKRITDFENFLWLAKQSQFSDGMLLDVITNGKRRFVSMPFMFKGGPLIGPNRDHWQLGGPLNAPAFNYGRLVAFPNSASPSFMICQTCGHTEPASAGGSLFCPNDGTPMVRNQ